MNLNSGAYLIIEHTEALHVIDVNSGFKSVSNNQELNALETNLEAAEEIARQFRLRDLGGIIFFSDMPGTGDTGDSVSDDDNISVCFTH